MARGSTSSAVALVLLAATFALTACTASGPTVVKSGHRFAAVDEPQAVTPAALISGTLDIDDRGCWTLRNGDQTSVMMWPSGTALSGRTILLPGLDPRSTGTAFQGSGGSGNPSSVAFPPCIEKGDVVTSIADIELSR